MNNMRNHFPKFPNSVTRFIGPRGLRSRPEPHLVYIEPNILEVLIIFAIPLIAMGYIGDGRDIVVVPFD